MTLEIFTLIFLALAGIISFTVAIVLRKRLKKENLMFLYVYEKQFNVLQKLRSLAIGSIKMLKDNNPPAIWSEIHQAFAQIDYLAVEREFNKIADLCKKSFFMAGKAKMRLDSFKRTLDNINEVITNIEKRFFEVDTAKTETNILFESLPGKIAMVKEAIRHPDVLAKTKQVFETATDHFNEGILAASAIPVTNINWLDVYYKLKKASLALDDVFRDVESDKENVTKVRMEGPEFLRKFPQFLEEVRDKINSLTKGRKSKGEEILKKARTEFKKAYAMAHSNGGADVNWEAVCSILLVAESLCSQAVGNSDGDDDIFPEAVQVQDTSFGEGDCEN